MTRLHGIFLVMLSLIIPRLSLAEPWDYDSIKVILDDRMLNPVEGLWEFPADGATLLVHKSSDTEFDIRIIDSPCLSIRPGTLIGSVCVTAKDKYYEGSINSKALGKKVKLKGNNLILNVTDNGYLCFKGYRSGYGVSFKRWFYRMFKISLIEFDERPDGLTGAKRIYPIDQYSNLPVCL